MSGHRKAGRVEGGWRVQDHVVTQDQKTEVGATGGDLRFWRAREALRHGELRLKTQSDATQALEGRATAMLGWSVAGVLALGAAVVNHTHAAAAGSAAAGLIGAALLCVVAITQREWSGPGYRPKLILDDRSANELEATESLVGGYQKAVERNSQEFNNFRRMLNWAMLLIVLAPVLGAVGLLLTG